MRREVATSAIRGERNSRERLCFCDDLQPIRGEPRNRMQFFFVFFAKCGRTND